jgi:hypothetical protein
VEWAFQGNVLRKWAARKGRARWSISVDRAAKISCCASIPRAAASGRGPALTSSLSSKATTSCPAPGPLSQLRRFLICDFGGKCRIIGLRRFRANFSYQARSRNMPSRDVESRRARKDTFCAYGRHCLFKIELARRGRAAGEKGLGFGRTPTSVKLSISCLYAVQLLQFILHCSEHSLPIARRVLPKEMHCRVPRTTHLVQEPSPVRNMPKR